MKLADLVTWVTTTIELLGASAHDRERVAHLGRLYATLTSSGEAHEAHAKEWHALARKCAALIGQQAPPVPEPGSDSIPVLDSGLRISRALEGRARMTGSPDGESHTAGDSRSEARTKRERARKKRERAREKRRRSSLDSSGGPSKAAKKPRRAEKKAEPQYEISPSVREALDAIRDGRRLLFVTGRAGTGKSTFITILKSELASKNIVVLAPTGIAALNAGGQTIHSFFQFPPKLLTREDIVRHKDAVEVLEEIDILVIDEVSMVRADLLDAVDESLRLHRESREPFGGVQVVLVGDLFQLPPVVPRGDDARILAERYRSFQFFGAHALLGTEMLPIELTHVYRQADEAFVSLLGDLRLRRNVDAACEELNRHCAGRVPDGPHLLLVPRNDAADRENGRRIEELTGKPVTYTASFEGQFRERADDRLPAPLELTLKPHAQVMFTKNDPERRWVNGTTGVVTKLTKATIEVRLQNGVVHDVEPGRWENIRYEFDRELDRIVPEVVGAYEQFPLMLAWAVTIHKAQGLTLDRVHVDFGRGAFAEGQAYVALSRCRKLADLSLARPLRPYDVKASAEVAQFYAALAASREVGVVGDGLSGGIESRDEGDVTPTFAREAESLHGTGTPAAGPFAGMESAEEHAVKTGVTETPAEAITIVSWTAGLASPPETAAAFADQNASIAVLAGSAADSGITTAFRDRGYGHITSGGGAIPVTIASRRPHEPLQIETLLGEAIDGFAAIRIDGLTILGSSFPRGEAKQRPWDALLKFAAQSIELPVLLIGDLKTGLHHVDETGATLLYADRFARLIELGWIDLWRAQHGDATEWSWLSPRNRGFRIDHAFASPAQAARVTRCDYSHEERERGMSDHSMVIVEIGNDRQGP